MIRLLFPYVCIERDLLKEGAISEDYIKILKDAIDGMRKKDTVGRSISNQYTGWQSNDGCESHPAFQKIMRIIKNTFDTELLDWNGLDRGQVQLTMGNSWANINDNTAWNAPHLHNGCWYSGVFYIHADGDEGDFIAVDKDPKVVSDFPHSPREQANFKVSPTTGTLFLFPSGLMHMVEPNMTQKDRYSISFNMNVTYLTAGLQARLGNPKGYHPDELTFTTDEDGKLVHLFPQLNSND
jgi:uncharacterized protein (TIGR02466 family)